MNPLQKALSLNIIIFIILLLQLKLGIKQFPWNEQKVATFLNGSWTMVLNQSISASVYSY